jgi:seryl-tRNA synthetase
MLTIKNIRENKVELLERLSKRMVDYSKEMDEAIALDDRRKSTQTELDNTLAEANSIAKSIGSLFREGKRDEAEVLKSKSAELKERSKELESQSKAISHDLKSTLLSIPNAPEISVPKGNDERSNETLSEHGNIPTLHDKALPHWELAKKYDLIDFELGVKITGAGFPVYKGKGARLQRALINFFLDQAREHGYLEVLPPIFVNEDSGYGTGQLPDKEGQMYHITNDNLYVIPTAEVPITNMYRDVILKADDFPLKNCGYTPCFRREAGSYGKDVRGLNRLHQFDKVEIVQVVHPKGSYAVLEDMQNYVQSLLRTLELPYRVLKLCGGDLGFAAALTYDMEVYSVAQDKWLEVSSISNFESFQTNRLKLRYRNEEGKTSLAHTLNGSALALPRIVAALLENNQDETGINIPKALHSYTGFSRIE